MKFRVESDFIENTPKIPKLNLILVVVLVLELSIVFQ